METTNKKQLKYIPENEADEIKLFKSTYGKDLSDLELALFFTHARKVGLDPLKSQIYCIKRGGKITLQTSIDGFRAIASRSGSHAGTDEIEFTYNGTTLVEAKCTVWKIVQGHRVAFIGKAKWVEFYPGEKMGHMWNKLPNIMLGKVAETQALRRAFPEDLGQLYVPEELERTLKTVDVKRPETKALEAEIDNKPSPDFIEYGETEEIINE